MTRWGNAPANPRLAADELHIWMLPLGLDSGLVERFRATLGRDELARAGRFHFERHRNHFIAAHGQVRATLGQYLGRPASALRFRLGAKGKPYLAAEPPELQFNLAHSGELALLAVHPSADAGVDIEFHRDGVAGERIAERFFSAAEVKALRSLPKPDREAAFFRCWTRKEAFLKANGKGLSFGLNQFSVSFLPGEPAALLETPFDPAEAKRWSLFHLDVRPGYTAAAVVRGGGATPRCWRARPA